MSAARLALRLTAVVAVLPVAACGSDSGTGGPDAAMPAIDSGSLDAGPCPPTDLTPPGSSECPAACTTCLPGNICHIECASGSCNDTTITCPPGYACEITCTGLDACDTSVIECPPAYACSVTCSSYDACGDVSLHCGSGSCSMSCTGTGASDSCGGSTVMCGTGPCSTTCEGQSPVVDCTSSCGCTPC